MSDEKEAELAKVAGAGQFTAPYRSSWFDSLETWVEGLPLPPWLFYLGLAAALGIAGTGIQWYEGAYPAGTFLPLHAWTFANGAYFLAFMHYIDRSASAALRASRPLLHAQPIEGATPPIDEATYSRLEYQLTALPWRPALAATVGGVLFALLAYLPQTGGGSIPRIMLGSMQTPLSSIVVLTIFVLSSAVAILFLYHTIHQLRLISRLYARYVRINLYQLGLLYGLSGPGVLAAIALILYTFIWWATAATTIQGIPPVEIGDTIVVSVIAAAMFALPLWGAHHRIVEEKRGRLSEVAARFEAATADLHGQLDLGAFSGMDQINQALSSLEIEQAALKRIPTWPWEPGTFRGLLAAVFLPVAVWFLQFLIGRLIGP